MGVDWVHYVFTEGGLTIGLAADLLLSLIIYVYGVSHKMSSAWLKWMLGIILFVLVRMWFDSYQSDIATIIALGVAITFAFLMHGAEMFLALTLLSALAYVISLVFSDERIQLLVLALTIAIGAMVYFKHYDKAQEVIMHTSVSFVTSFVIVVSAYFFYEKFIAKAGFTQSVEHFRQRIDCISKAKCLAQVAIIAAISMGRLVVLYLWIRKEAEKEALSRGTVAIGVPDTGLREMYEFYQQQKQAGGLRSTELAPLIPTKAATQREELLKQLDLPSDTRREESVSRVSVESKTG
jgi:hypothetical protein